MHDEVDRDHCQRIKRSGTWRAGRLAGDYVASGGRSDNYLELHLAHGRFTRQHLTRVDRRSADISVRRFGGGRGLAILRVAPPEARTRDGTNPDWVGELVAVLQPALPALRLDQADDTPRPDPSTPSEQPALATAPDSSHAPPAGAAASDETRQLLPGAATALERAGFKEAERLGRLAHAAGEADALEFLETLRAIRRGAKLVRRWPRDAQSRLELAQAYFLADAGAAAVREATEALRLDPALGEAHALLGLEHVYQGEHERARSAWERAQTLAPTGEWQQALARMLHNETPNEAGAVRGWAARAERRWRSLVRKVVPQLGRDQQPS